MPAEHGRPWLSRYVHPNKKNQTFLEQENGLNVFWKALRIYRSSDLCDSKHVCPAKARILLNIPPRNAHVFVG